MFCNRKREVAQLHRSLVRHGFNAAALHGDLDQAARTAALESFRQGEVKLLIASDVAARGLDIPDVSHIFNFDVPHHADDYVHRIGRTGRAGKSGIAITIVSPADGKSVAAIEKLIGQSIGWADAPAQTEPAAADRPPQHREHRGHREQGRHQRHGGAREERRGHDQPRPREQREPAAARNGDAKPRHAPPRPRAPSEPDGGHLPAFLLRPVRG